jgi:nitrogen fixation protein NifU and related proteins
VVAEEAYSETVLEHFANPRNAGVMDDPDGVGVQNNPVCGDTMRLMLRIRDGVVSEVRWQTAGCPAAIATSSIASEMITGRTLDELAGLTRDQIVEAAGGLPTSKLHCSVLAQDAVRRAIAAYRAKAAS